MPSAYGNRTKRRSDGGRTAEREGRNCGNPFFAKKRFPRPPQKTPKWLSVGSGECRGARLCAPASQSLSGKGAVAGGTTNAAEGPAERGIGATGECPFHLN
jgi:hypothetical protein